MTEAKKLQSEPPLREPALFEAEAVSLPPGDLMAPVSLAPATRIPQPAPATRSFTTHMLIFFLMGLLTFAVGAALATALVTGALDSHTGQLKELMHRAKDLIHLTHDQ